MDVLLTTTALQIVHRMGESGLPPELGIESVNVGNESYLDVLDHEYLETHLAQAGGSTFKLVQGTYGSGKTHFLYCVRSRARRRGFLTAFVTLTSSRGECPFDSPLHVYQACAQGLTRPGPHEAAPSFVGWTDILADWARVLAHTRGAQEAAREIDSTLARTPVAFQPYRLAVVKYMKAVVSGSAAVDPLGAWLLGQAVPAADVRALGLYEVPREAVAFAMLRSMIQMVRALGLPGTVLLFDEGEKQLSFAKVDARSTREVLNNLRETIDLCGRAELPSTLVAYAVTPDFMHNVLPRYPALQQRLCFPIAFMSVRSPLAPVIDLEQLDLAPGDLLTRLADRLHSVYRTAYGWAGDPELIAHNRDVLVRQVLDRQLEVSHRRVFVKSWLRVLDEGRRVGMSRMERGHAQSVVDGVEESFAPGADFVDF